MAENISRGAQASPPSIVSANVAPKGVTQSEISAQEKRQRHPSRKALQNSIRNTTAELSRQAKALRNAADDVYAALRDKSAAVHESTLREPTQKYEDILGELEGLYAQDKWGDALDDAERIRQSGQSNLQYARTALEKAKAVRFRDQVDDRKSRKSRRSSRRSSSRSSATSVKTEALAEAAAAKKQAEYDRIIAEKEHERRQSEAEEQRLREQRRAVYDRDMALLAAEKLAAIADAKLSAIEKSMEEEKSCTSSNESVVENARRRTQQWVNAQDNTKSVIEEQPRPLPIDTLDPNLERNLDEDTTVPIYGLTPIQSERVPQSRPTLGHDTSSPQQANIQGGTQTSN